MFNEALESLDTDRRSQVHDQVEAWKSGACPKWRRVASNVASETAVSVESFAGLLADFCEALQSAAADPGTCWVAACRKNQFRGLLLASPLPEMLGRATTLDGYAGIVSDSPSIALSADECGELIRKVAMPGASVSPRELRILKRARLGRYVVWATFNNEDPSSNPFDHFPKTTEAVRTALGLGECSETEALILICYRPGENSGTIELFRPTIAEAESYSWYVPHSDSAARWGYTEPLSPNPLGLVPQPEVVHGEITGESLVFPLYLAV